VFAGTPASPSSQYVVLQMASAGQNFVSGHSVIVYNAAGTEIARFTFPGNVANGANQAKILIATAQASAFFGVSANLTMTPVIPAAGGKICFDDIDCDARGNYSGSSVGVGAPFNNPQPCDSAGIPPGRAMVRRLDVSGGATTLETTDDTDNSANDFRLGTPAPRNNANQNGTIPASTCGNGVIEGVESCDDNNTVNGDGCSASCAPDCPAGVGVEPGTLSGVRLTAVPSPFENDLAVFLSLPETRLAEVGIYDLSGRRVRWLHRGSLEAGPHRWVWDGLDDRGSRPASGVYFVVLRSGDLRLRTTVVRLR
jgi:cysteine-rich repeat protein